MKKVLFILSFLTGFIVHGQVYNNEWISDYNKTYYKFKVGKTGLYRIPQPTLAAAGLGATPAQHFQLFRNGKEIPIYISATAGVLSGTDYIEFWGEMNDGKPDKGLYRRPDYQLNDKWSLETDTATYFLTTNTGVNLRLQASANNVAGNTLPVEPYFMHKVGRHFRDRINPGYAVNVGEYLYSSAYDKGEGWSSADIGSNGTNSFTFNNLFVNTSGPAPSASIAVSGNAINTRKFRLKINGDSIVGNNVDFFNYMKDGAVFSNSTISSGTAVVEVTNLSPFANDRMVIHQYEITYPRQFNFGGANNFEFKLPAGLGGNYLEIAGFSYGGSIPVLYDLTNGKRYVADISTPSLLKIALEPSSTERSLVLVSEEAGNISFINSLQSRTFINYRLAQNQGNFLIISNPLLFNGANGTNPVEDYRAYRSSVEGGSNNAKIYLIGDLVDQFGFGIKMHPAAVRNFLLFARQNFTNTPKHVFIIGKGIHYLHQRGFENDPNLDKLHFVPTFGWPASDVLLSADPGDAIPQIPIGRLSVINAQEIDLYLKKIKEYELAQRTGSPFIKDKAWMKNVAHVVGASEPALQFTLDNYMENYKRIISDTFYGAKVTTFTKSSPEAVEQLNNGEMDRLFAEGMSLITYFG
ncbi:MAG: C25 family cysteine peptidase, partial [Chitinophagaceae bacterium]